LLRLATFRTAGAVAARGEPAHALMAANDGD
jgi:hypothetical protein